MADEPRAYTVEEVQDKVLKHIAFMAKYWATVQTQDGAKTTLDRCNGLAFSILAMIDGSAVNLPALDLHLSPHEDDKAFNIGEGSNYFEPDMLINDCHLHDLWHKYELKE